MTAVSSSSKKPCDSQGFAIPLPRSKITRNRPPSVEKIETVGTKLLKLEPPLKRTRLPENSSSKNPLNPWEEADKRTKARLEELKNHSKEDIQRMLAEVKPREVDPRIDIEAYRKADREFREESKALAIRLRMFQDELELAAKLKGCGVDAVPQAGGSWPIGKDMAEVGAAPAAQNLGAGAAQAVVDLGGDVPVADRSAKAGPSGP